MTKPSTKKNYFPLVKCPECGAILSKALCLDLAYNFPAICEQCGSKIHDISPHLKKVIQKLEPTPPLKKFESDIPDSSLSSDLNDEEDLKNSRKQQWDTFKLTMRRIPKMWRQYFKNWRKSLFRSEKSPKSRPEKKNGIEANSLEESAIANGSLTQTLEDRSSGVKFRLIEEIEVNGDQSINIPAEEVISPNKLSNRSEVYTVLEEDVRNRLLSTPLTQYEQDVIAKSFIYMTLEQQRKYLAEIESTDEGNEEDIQYLVDIINDLPIPEHQKIVLIDQLNYIPDTEHEDFIQTLKNSNNHS